MKKLLSAFLALVIILSVGTVVTSAYSTLTQIYIATRQEHVRKGDVVYYPHEFDNRRKDFADVCNELGIKEGEAKLRIKYEYDPTSLELVDVLESKVLYDAGGKAEIVEHYDVDISGWSLTKGFVIEVTFDINAGIDNEIIFNLKFNVIEENFITEQGDVSTDSGANLLLASERYCIESENFKWLLCEVTDANGKVYDLSDYFSLYRNSFGDYFETYDDLLITYYDPFEPPTGDIREVTYVQSDDTHKNFTVRANDRQQMIQFIEPDGGTRTYDRYNKNVSITSYDADGNEVNEMSRDLAYEVWEIYSNMSVGTDIKVRGKKNGVWENGRCTFKVEPYNPVKSIKLSWTVGSKKCKVPAEVIADSKTELAMLKMPNGTTVTVAPSLVAEDGSNIFNPTAWINEEGLNQIKVYIRRDNQWIYAGTLKYMLDPDYV